MSKNKYSIIEYQKVIQDAFKKTYAIKNQITTLQGKIKTLFEDYMNGNITSNEYKSLMTKTKADIETSQDELKKYESLINVTYNEELYKLD